MSDGVTVDANVMNEFDKQYRANIDDVARLLVERLTVTKGFVIDDGGRIEHQWLTTCQGPFFKEWFVAQLYQGIVKYVSPKIALEHKKKLGTQLGFPKNDVVYVAVANVTQTKYVVTNDIDFFDPTQKRAEQPAKVRARDERRGPVCRYLRDRMGITVGTVIHAWEELSSPPAE